MTINGSTQNTVINDATGDFSIAFNTTGFASGTYPVTYVSATDMVGLIGATNTSTSLTLGAPPARPTILPPRVAGHKFGGQRCNSKRTRLLSAVHNQPDAFRGLDNERSHRRDRWNDHQSGAHQHFKFATVPEILWFSNTIKIP